MFYTGTLQAGIALAIQESKLVACFVADQGDESKVWEQDWLRSGWISSLLEQKSVLLRLEAGSTEAGFLAAFCPVEKVPGLVVIHNGQLRDRIESGVTQEEFVNRVRKALGAGEIPVAAIKARGGGAAETVEEGVQEDVQAQIPTPAPVAAPARPVPAPARPAAAPPRAVPAPPSSHPPSSALPPSAKAKGKQKATPPDPEPSANKVPAQQAARDALRKKKQEEKEELARIQARIESDKAERKARAAALKAERELERSQNTSTSLSQPAQSISTSNKGTQSKSVNLNVRLFDGRTIRSTFPRTSTLDGDVRPWIDIEFTRLASESSSSDKHPPYFFKQIQAPLPSRELSAGDEGQELGDIGLAPSATLVLIPVKGYTEAYSGGSSGIVGTAVGGVTGIVGGVFGLASTAVGFVGSTLGSVVGGFGGSNTDQQGQQGQFGRRLDDAVQNTEGGSTPSAPIRVRTIADQREGERQRDPASQRLYNGNSLNFEPNDKDKDDEAKRQ